MTAFNTGEGRNGKNCVLTPDIDQRHTRHSLPSLDHVSTVRHRSTLRERSLVFSGAFVLAALCLVNETRVGVCQQVAGAHSLRVDRLGGWLS